MATATDVQNRIEYEHSKDAIDALDTQMRQRQCEGHAGRWRYRDPEGEIIAQLFRYDLPPRDGQLKRKALRWICRTGNRWRIGPPATPWPLYFRDDLGNARRIYLVASEACADELRTLGLTATTSACGAKAVDRTDWAPLAGKEVIILTGAGKLDTAYRDAVTAPLGNLSPTPVVKVVTVDEEREVPSWIARQSQDHASRRELAKRIQEMADDANKIERSGAPAAAAPSFSRGGKALATRLVKYSLEELDLFHTDERVGYATLKASPRATWPLREKTAAHYLRHLCYLRETTAPTNSVIQTALNTLESMAVFDGPEHRVHTRLGNHDGSIYLDLGDETWRGVRITPGGWEVIEDCPARFLRSRGMLPLPAPVRGGNLDELWKLLNIPSEDDRRLILAWLLCALRPTGPYFVLCLHGEQGSAKSTTAFTVMNDLSVSIQGQCFNHMVYHFVLTYSNWESATICFSESFESLSEGLQNALLELGGVPQRHRTDRMSTAVNNLSDKKEFTQRYQALLAHYGMAGEKIQADHANENGDIEQRHRRFKTAIDQALMLRGSRDFASREAYGEFLQQRLAFLNAGRRDRLKEERAQLRPLPARRLEACKRLQARVDSGSLIHVDRNSYSVPSRLIGEKVEVRLFVEHLEVWYAQKRVEHLPRLRGRDKHRVNYRHVIDWLVRTRIRRSNRA
jgi:hypothetical protein